MSVFLGRVNVIIGVHLIILAAIEAPLILMAKGLFLPFAIQVATDIAPPADAGRR